MAEIKVKIGDQTVKCPCGGDLKFMACFPSAIMFRCKICKEKVSISVTEEEPKDPCKGCPIASNEACRVCSLKEVK